METDPKNPNHQYMHKDYKDEYNKGGAHIKETVHVEEHVYTTGGTHTTGGAHITGGTHTTGGVHTTGSTHTTGGVITTGHVGTDDVHTKKPNATVEGIKASFQGPKYVEPELRELGYKAEEIPKDDDGHKKTMKEKAHDAVVSLKANLTGKSEAEIEREALEKKQHSGGVGVIPVGGVHRTEHVETDDVHKKTLGEKVHDTVEGVKAKLSHPKDEHVVVGEHSKPTMKEKIQEGLHNYKPGEVNPPDYSDQKFSYGTGGTTTGGINTDKPSNDGHPSYPHGTAGTYGTTGTAGTYGTTGVHGTAGTYGTTGTAGTYGTTGTAGTYGTTGVHGTAGTYGTTGVHGTTGLHGTTGTYGTTGTGPVYYQKDPLEAEIEQHRLATHDPTFKESAKDTIEGIKAAFQGSKQNDPAYKETGHVATDDVHKKTLGEKVHDTVEGVKAKLSHNKEEK